jgi:hypothetical protein
MQTIKKLVKALELFRSETGKKGDSHVLAGIFL